MAETTCPTCGELVHVVATREGTNHYVSHWRIEWEKADRAFKQAERERDEAKARVERLRALVDEFVKIYANMDNQTADEQQVAYFSLWLRAVGKPALGAEEVPA